MGSVVATERYKTGADTARVSCELAYVGIGIFLYGETFGMKLISDGEEAT
jgi:hypothetical protein